VDLSASRFCLASHGCLLGLCSSNEGERLLERIGHSSVVEAANWTLNVMLGVPPVIVHRTRWKLSMFAGNARVSLLIPVLAGYVSRTVHAVPSGLSSMNTVSVGVPLAAVQSSFDTAPELERDQPPSALVLLFVARAADGTTIS